jgi:two-component system chemotaxis sensor kinase CheA
VNDEFSFSTGMPSEEMAQYIQMFVDETGEQLDGLVEVLLVLESNPTSQSELNESFRLIHSIKGASGMMGLDSIKLLTHHLENHFERLRSGLQTLDQSMMDLILRCVDFLREAIELLRHGRPLSSAPELLEELAKHLQGGSETSYISIANETKKTAEDTRHPLSSAATATDQPSELTAQLPAPTAKRLIAYFSPTLELPDLKAELILARIAQLGTVLRISPTRDDWASVAALGTFQLWVRTNRTDRELRAAAEVVGVDLLEIDSVSDESLDDESLGTARKQVAVEEVAISPKEDAVFSAIPATEANAAAETTPLTGPAQTVRSEGSQVSTPAMQPKQVLEAPSTAAGVEGKSVVVETVRVDIQRLDRLMNLTGELIVNRARFVQLAQKMSATFKKTGLLGNLRDLCEGLRQSLPAQTATDQHKDERTVELELRVEAIEEQLHVLEDGRRSFVHLNGAIDQLLRVSDGLQRGVLDTRMVPIGPLFNRFKRTVRDIAGEMNKKVNLQILGENTELDKRMIDELGDPILHLVRNAIDHGLESEATRESRGKPNAGTLSLEAVHSGNNVLIYIRDDGGGINYAKVQSRAVERGLVSQAEAQTLTDREIAQFIWSPGFSTAETVSDISGRGVGMDIVKTRIAELNGSVEVDSKLGVGTTFLIRLPLTLAIIRSLLFRLRQGIFGAPIENVQEIVSVDRSAIISVLGRHSIEVRGEFIPLLDIEDIFDWHKTEYAYPDSDTVANECQAATISVLIVTAGNKTIGLRVNALIGCEDLVVKSLVENFRSIRGLAGASILGDGSVCLLLDITACIDLAHERLIDRRGKNTHQ